MPIERYFDAEAKVFWTVIRGPITFHELRQHIGAVHELGGHEVCGIADVRDAKPRLTAKDLQLLAAHGRRLFVTKKMAPRAVIVSQHDLVAFGLARLFAILARPWLTLRVFDNVPAALAFIGAMSAAAR